MVTERSKYEKELKNWELHKADTWRAYRIDVEHAVIRHEDGRETRNPYFRLKPKKPASLVFGGGE